MAQKAFNYTAIPEDVKKRIRADLNTAGFTLVTISKYSANPADHYLYYVMGKGGYRDGYATFIYNTSIGGLGEGHFDMDYKFALVDFANRIN